LVQVKRLYDSDRYIRSGRDATPAAEGAREASQMAVFPWIYAAVGGEISAGTEEM
jgi:hypothetical protein